MNGTVAHECIIDLRPYKSVTAEDVAKRLMDRAVVAGWHYLVIKMHLLAATRAHWSKNGVH